MKDVPENELLSAYLDGELTADEQGRVEQLLAESPSARQLLDELRALSATLQSMPQYAIGEDISEQVLRSAERQMLLGSETKPRPLGQSARQMVKRFVNPRAVFWSSLAIAVAVFLTVNDANRNEADRELAKAPAAAGEAADVESSLEAPAGADEPDTLPSVRAFDVADGVAAPEADVAFSVDGADSTPAVAGKGGHAGGGAVELRSGGNDLGQTDLATAGRRMPESGTVAPAASAPATPGPGSLAGGHFSKLDAAAGPPVGDPQAGEMVQRGVVAKPGATDDFGSASPSKVGADSQFAYKAKNGALADKLADNRPNNAIAKGAPTYRSKTAEVETRDQSRPFGGMAGGGMGGGVQTIESHGFFDGQQQKLGDEQYVVVYCDLTPEAVRDGAFQKLLASNGIAFDDALAVTDMVRQEKGNARGGYQVPADAMRGRGPGASLSGVMRKDSSGDDPYQIIAPIDVVEAEATPEQIQATLNDLHVQTGDCLAMAVVPDNAPGPQQTWRRFNRSLQQPASRASGEKAPTLGLRSQAVPNEQADRFGMTEHAAKKREIDNRFGNGRASRIEMPERWLAEQRQYFRKNFDAPIEPPMQVAQATAPPLPEPTLPAPPAGAPADAPVPPPATQPAPGGEMPARDAEVPRTEAIAEVQRRAALGQTAQSARPESEPAAEEAEPVAETPPPMPEPQAAPIAPPRPAAPAEPDPVSPAIVAEPQVEALAEMPAEASGEASVESVEGQAQTMRTLTRKQEEPSASVASRPRRTTATAQTDPPGTAPAETAAGSDAGGRPQLVRGPAPHDHVFEMEEAPRMAEPAEEPAQAVAESKAQGQREEFARQPVANRSHRDADSGSGQSGGWGVELEGAHGTLQNDGPSPPTCRVLFVLRTVGPDSAGQAAARAAQREADASIMLPSAAAPAEPPPAAEQ